MTRRSSVRTACVSAIVGFAVATGAFAQSDFFGQKSAWFRDQVVEGASKHPEAPAEAPATVTVLTADEIHRYGFRTVADVLNFASVGSFTNYDRRYDLAGSRGLFFFEDFNTRILVLLNGHPLNEPWNNFGGVGREMLVPLELADRVEIVYGPSSLLYGGYSLYGIVNVVTKSGASIAGARLLLRGGSLGEREAMASYGAEGVAGEKATRWNILGAGGYYEADGENLNLPLQQVEYPATPAGELLYGGSQSGTDAERAPFGFLYGQYGNFTLMARTGYRRHGAALAPYESVYGSRDEHVSDNKSFVDASWEQALGSQTTLSVRTFYDWYSYDEQDPYVDFELYPNASGYNFILKASNADRGAEVRVNSRIGTHQLTAGTEYRQRSIRQHSWNDVIGEGRDESSFLGDSVNGRLLVAYAQDEWRPLTRWTFVAGATFADTHPGGQKTQPRVAVIYKPAPQLAIKALYGTGFRPPSMLEAAYEDNVSSIGNPSLRSEQIHSAELSMTWELPSAAVAQVYGFRSRLKGLIGAVVIESPDQVQGGVLPPSGNVEDLIGTIQYQSLADVTSTGAGTSLRYMNGPFRTYGNLAWAKAKYQSTEEQLSGTPLWLASAGASYDWRTFSVGAAARYVGSQKDPSRGTETSSGDYFDTTVRLAWDTTVKAYPLTFFLDGRNLFDAAGAVSAAPIYTPVEVPIEPRRFSLGVEARF